MKVNINKVNIPPILGGDSLVFVLDELKHQLKPGVAMGNPLCKSFNEMLNGFLARWALDRDQHSFVAWPERITMKCTHCGGLREMHRLYSGDHIDGPELPSYQCKCGCQHVFEGSYEEFEAG